MKADGNQNLHAMRHSMAHILASAVQRLWPIAKFGVGPVVENGFYYDIDLDKNSLTDEDLDSIESEMHKIIAEDQKFEKYDLPIDDALEWAKKSKQPYKVELLNDLKRDGTTAVSEIATEDLGISTSDKTKITEVSFYKNGDFTDLCRGPHLKSTKQAGAFKLMRISGAYWRGQEKNRQMQRVYGVAFSTTKDLQKHLEQLEEAKKRDHRRIGQELDLFVFSDLVGPGLPLFTPRGTVLRNELIRFSEELQVEHGYQAVWAPHIARTELYKKSGHYSKFPERFSVSSSESDDEFMMKPMNCPHVAQIYASRPRSYRDLPLRYMETTTMYRDEKSGELHGLSRVRSLTQDDSHAFCRDDQIETEFKSIIEVISLMYKALGMDLSFRLSFRDESDAYLGELKDWQEAERVIRKVAKESGVKHWEALGEAAFYGPKIDIMIDDSLGRQWQCATVQLDFVQPGRFNLEYTDSNGQAKQPFMIHKAVLGSIERFLAVYIEHTNGNFPIWLAPEQIRILTVNDEDKTMNFAQQLARLCRDSGLRFSIDSSNESVGKKIRQAELLKIPYTVVVGEKEVQTEKVMPRLRSDLKVVDTTESTIEIDRFIQTVANEIKSRASKSSF